MSAPNSDEGTRELQGPPLVDGWLQLVVSIQNESDSEDGSWTALTLAVSGVVVSGELISYNRFWREVGASGHKGLEALSAEILAPPDGEATATRPLPQYIHLRNAKIWNNPASPFPQNGTLWRGRIADVNGFSFGQLGAASS